VPSRGLHLQKGSFSRIKEGATVGTVKLSDFDYQLPPERIAQRPAERRDASRLLLFERASGRWEDQLFAELPHILRGDELLVVNNTRVLPARLLGRRVGVHAEAAGRHSRVQHEHLRAQIEVLLLRPTGADTWECLVRPGRKVRAGERLLFGEGELQAEVIGRGELGLREIRLSASAGEVREQIERLGHMPLPPYIDRPDEPLDRQRYQTVFARCTGAIAAPTAGLHFTPEILGALQSRGISRHEITLHVGLGTFQPIHEENVEEHEMHAEEYEIPEEVAAAICEAKQNGRPVVAVGTTVVRALEDAAAQQAQSGAASLLTGARGAASLFIYPGFEFRVVDQLLTNFHLPKSTLLVLVSAFAGREKVLAAYRHAVEAQYRFYSYGDCMLIR
jgi:S-adenosylmethionine:tRNA ribosyltransferase-isomerase